MNVNEVEAVFKEFENTRTDIEVTIEELKQELLPYENRIVLYGAGSAGIAFYHYLNDAGIQVSCFADGDAEKNGYEDIGDLLSGRLLHSELFFTPL